MVTDLRGKGKPCYSSRMESLSFYKLFDLPKVPGDWKLVRLALNWSGHPLLLYVEGKPPEPDFKGDMEAWSRWYRTPPKAHHLIFWESNKLHSVAFDRSQGLSTFHIQPFESGWLLGERRNGQTTVYDAHGAVRSVVDLGDAIEDLQTTPDGRIWVSYFDEGVSGRGVGRQGLICFDVAGRHIFEYADFAEQNALPMICDCYALNVDQTGDVWLNYYTDFPLVRLHNYKVDEVWHGFGTLGNAFAVRDNRVIYTFKEHMAIRHLTSPTESEPQLVIPQDDGNVLKPSSQCYVDIAARGTSFVVNTGSAVYTMRDTV